MPYKFEDVQFTWDSLYICNIFDFIFLEDFDCDWFMCVLMYCLFDFSECAFADGCPDYFRQYSMV